MAGCYPATYISGYEDMLRGGANYQVVHEAMVQGGGSAGKGCLYTWKGYAESQKSYYPLFHSFNKTVNYN